MTYYTIAFAYYIVGFVHGMFLMYWLWVLLHPDRDLLLRRTWRLLKVRFGFGRVFPER